MWSELRDNPVHVLISAIEQLGIYKLYDYHIRNFPNLPDHHREAATALIRSHSFSIVLEYAPASESQHFEKPTRICFKGDFRQWQELLRIGD